MTRHSLKLNRPFLNNSSATNFLPQGLERSLTPVLIASLVSLTPSVAWSQTEEMSQPQFMCQSEQTLPINVAQIDGETKEQTPPMTVVQMDGETNEPTPPMTVVQIDGKTEVIATWYSEYLLENTSPTQICQEVAQKLQQRYERQQPSLFAYEPIKIKERWERWDVCLVSEEGQKCTEEGSEVLFSLNSDYIKPAQCILENKPPRIDPESFDSCPPVPTKRGNLLSVPSSNRGYSPAWLRLFRMGN